MISVPLLIGTLRDTNAGIEANAIRGAFADFQHSRVITGLDVDRTESEILALCPTLALKLVRKFSYANLIYQRVRSSFSHEYRPGEKTVSMPMTSDDSVPVSYYNWMNDVDRHIYFHVTWLAGLVAVLGTKAEAEAGNFPLTAPSSWWIDG